MDGVFDLFHVGHIDAIKQCNQLGTSIIGVISDHDAEKYKRKPIINESHRVEMVRSCKYVNDVIYPAPLQLTEQFIHNNNIDIVVHAFFDQEDFEKQKSFFENINLKRIEYSNRISTTEIIKLCNEHYEI